MLRKRGRKVERGEREGGEMLDDSVGIELTRLRKAIS